MPRKNNCYYCNRAPSQVCKSGSSTDDFVYNDRINPDVGYVPSNVVTCCSVCNYAKGSMSKEGFIQLVERIYVNRIIDIESKRRCVFLGRWQPMHNGHVELIRQKLDQKQPCLILVRATPVDDKNPFTLQETIEMIRAAFIGDDVKVMPIYDVEGFYYGRKVGYNVEEIDLPESTKRISATDIRNKIANNDNSWKDFVNPKVAKWLEDYYDSND